MNRHTQRRLACWGGGCLWLLGAASGCSRQDEITRYTVPRRPVEKILGTIPSGGEERSAGETARILGAIVPHGRKTWFFKLMGPEQEVAAHQAGFDEFLHSLRFASNSKEPEWNLPPEWHRLPGDGMRFASLQMGSADKPLELTVIPLSTGADRDQYVLANLNRWRKQLGLTPADSLNALEADASVWQMPVGAGTTATVIDFVGEYGTADLNKPLMASGPPPMTGRNDVRAASSATRPTSAELLPTPAGQ